MQILQSSATRYSRAGRISNEDKDCKSAPTGGINPGVTLPLYADIGSRFSSIRTHLVKGQYVSKDGSNVTEAWPWARRTEIQNNGDLVVHTMFETEKRVPETYVKKFFGRQRLVPAHMETTYFNYYNPVLVSNYRHIVQSLVISW